MKDTSAEDLKGKIIASQDLIPDQEDQCQTMEEQAQPEIMLKPEMVGAFPTLMQQMLLSVASIHKTQGTHLHMAINADNLESILFESMPDHYED